VSGLKDGSEADGGGCHPHTGGSVHRAGCTDVLEIGQWTGVHRYRGPQVAGASFRSDVVHRTGLSLGEWLRGVVQRQAERRTLESGDLLYPDRSSSAFGALADPLQYQETAQFARLSSTGSRGYSDANELDRNYDRTNLNSGTTTGGRSLEQGYRVRCLVRDRRRLAAYPWSTSVEVVEGDVLQVTSIDLAFRQVDVVYYLVHSMSNPQGDFAELDRQAARNVGDAAERFGVDRIIYLGGLGKRGEEQSPHLRSRHEVGDVLRKSGVPVTEFRAAVIVGAGSLSFEMIHHLANRLPVMICPRWVVTRTQPIAVDDVLSYLVAALGSTESAGRVIDIGGPEILTYREMMLVVARALGLKRWLIKVPVLTPRLSSYWVGLVTPVPVKPARALIEGLRHETICENDDAKRLFPITPIGFDQAVTRALSVVISDRSNQQVMKGESIISHLEPSHLLTDRRQATVKASSEQLFHVVSSIGGENGWYAADTLWKVRGLIDELVGGVGLRRGRPRPCELSVGDTLDFWRVEELGPGKRVLLRAEMKLPGKAWLEFVVDGTGQNDSILTQTARFYPKGLLGILYWYGIYPVHNMVFRKLVFAIGKRAESSNVGALRTGEKSSIGRPLP
jgi:uncharacterized protein YbjT (DUF2867 family)